MDECHELLNTTLKRDVPYSRRCGALKNLQCSMAMREKGIIFKVESILSQGFSTEFEEHALSCIE